MVFKLSPHLGLQVGSWPGTCMSLRMMETDGEGTTLVEGSPAVLTCDQVRQLARSLYAMVNTVSSLAQ